MKIEHWKETWGDLNSGNMRRRLEQEGYSVIEYVYSPGTYFSDHTHGHDKKDAVLSGRFMIRALGLEFVLGPGDMIAVPASTLHSAEVIGNEAVVSLDASKH